MAKGFFRRVSTAAIASIFAVSLLAILFVKNLAAGPTNDVRPGDVTKASREAITKIGVDFREPLGESGYIAGNGVVEPADRETKIGAAVPGRIARVLVREGQFVPAGTLLIELDDGPEKAALAAADGDLAVAQTTLTRVQRGLRREDIEALSGEAEAARARAKLSAEVAARIDRLANDSAVTEDERDRSDHEAEAAQGSLKAAEARRLAGVNGGRREDVLVAQAQVSAALARRDVARETLELLHVRSPIDATILQLKTRPGEYYNTLGAEPLLILGDTRVLKVRMDVDERDVAKLQLGSAAYVTLSAYPTRRFSGTVIDVGRRRMGRKNVRTDDPVEMIDAKILEVLLQISDSAAGLVPGIRVTAYVKAS